MIKPGDVFSATLRRAIRAEGGITIPAGGNAVLRVASITRDAAGGAIIRFDLLTVGVTGTSYEVESGGGTGTQAPMVERDATFGSCAPQGAPLQVTLTRAIRLVAR